MRSAIMARVHAMNRAVVRELGRASLGLRAPNRLQARHRAAARQAEPQADVDLRGLLSDDFEFSLADLDDDGHQELIVTSAGGCPRLGCPVQVLTMKQGRLVTLLSTFLPAGLAISREKQGAIGYSW